MRFSVAAASLFAASALAMADPYVTVTEVDWVTVTSCPPSYSTNCPLYSYKPSPVAAMKTTTTPCPEEKPVPVYTTTTTTTPYVAPVAPTTTPCNSTYTTTPVYVAPVPVYSTSWAYVCPHPEICHATSTVVPVAPTYAPAPTYASSNVTTPAAPVYTGAASSVNVGAGAVLGLVSLAAFFLA